MPNVLAEVMLLVSFLHRDNQEQRLHPTTNRLQPYGIQKLTTEEIVQGRSGNYVDVGL
jgi:hypothetical protein